MNFTECFHGAEWVMPSEECNSPYFRDEFSIKSISKAELTVCGLGFYYPYINGRRVTEDLFITLATDYHEHFNVHGEEPAHRIICQKYDVTSFLHSGKNAIGFLVGGGYYRYRDDYSPVLYGRVRVCYYLEITAENGEKFNCVSGKNMKWFPSFVRECDNFLLGETHDYNSEKEHLSSPDFSAADWHNTEIAHIPETKYEYMTSPADRIAEIIKPRLIRDDGSKKIYDVGKNITGWALTDLPENEFGEINIRFGEELRGGEPDEDKIFGQYFRIIPDGKKRTVHPWLTWHGFRYVEITGNAEMSGCAVIHADIPVRTEFHCSDEVLNWLYDAYLRTQLNNMHAGIPTDCPTIERRGYTGDGQLCAEAAMMLLDAKSFYRKWINDIADCQDRKSGHIQYTAPVITSGGGPGGWGCAIVEVPYMYYKTYGETDVLEENLDGMLRYFDYLDDHSENNLVVSDQPNCWCLGDWCTAEEIHIPEPYVNTYFYVRSLSRVIEICDITGRTELIPALREKQDLLKSAIASAYFDPETGNFCGGRQGANAFGLDLGLGDRRTLENTVSFYKNYGMFDTGIFGTDILPRVLFENGEAELACSLLTSKGKYSFGNWMDLGATTLWEYRTGERSHDHPMFGACTRYLFKYIRGIGQTAGTAGYKDLVISPAVISLKEASGTMRLETGELSVSYVRSESETAFVIQVPKGIRVRFEYMNFKKELSEGLHRFSC